MPGISTTVLVSIPLLFSVHWIAIQAYVQWCAPPGWSGFYQSIITSPSPVCIALNHIQYYAIHYYYSIWLAVGLLCLGVCQQQAGCLVSSCVWESKPDTESNVPTTTRKSRSER